MILQLFLAAVLTAGQLAAGQQTAAQLTAAECDSLALDMIDRNEYSEAVEMASRGVEAAEKSGDIDSKISCLCTMSTGYARLGELDKAIDCIRIVYEYDQQSGNPDDISYDLNLMAEICHIGGRDEEAADYIVKSIEYARKVGDEGRRSLAIRLGNASDIFRSLKKLPEAEAFAREALTIDKEDGREGKVGIRLCQLAGCLAANGKTVEAVKTYKESIDILTKVENRQSIGIACRELSTIIGSDKEAVEYLEKSYEIAKELGNTRDIVATDRLLASRLKKINPEEAYRHIEEAYSIRDSVFSQEKTAEIERLNVEFKTLEKEHELDAAKARTKAVAIAATLLAIIALLLGLNIAIIRRSKKELDRKNAELSSNLKAVSESYESLVAKKENNVPAADVIQFTPREMDIIKLSCKGRISKEIASDLGISVKTVDNIKRSLFDKTGVRTTLEVVIYAIRHGLA